MVVEKIIAYFPHLTALQQAQLRALASLYETWNSRINVISRKDMEHFYERHVLHSLSVAKFIRFNPGTCILDVGSGGGFPGIPLAILFPESHFTLLDSIGKKIKVVQAVAEALQLKNVEAFQGRAEQLTTTFEFVLSRAVADLPTFTAWVWDKIRTEGKHSLPNGIISLKGGKLDEELAATRKKFHLAASQIYELSISQWFSEDFFATKKIVYIAKQG